jgi:hypothetical protein
MGWAVCAEIAVYTVPSVQMHQHVKHAHLLIFLAITLIRAYLTALLLLFASHAMNHLELIKPYVTLAVWVISL